MLEGSLLVICNRCIEAAARLIRGSPPPWHIDLRDRRSAPRPDSTCGFCGRDGKETGPMVLLSEGSICPHCIALYSEMLTEPQSGGP